MPITKGFRQLVDEANACITTYSVTQVRERLADGRMQLVDIRDIREAEREGTIEGAVLAPRGMLEFWVDPDSPYYKPIFGEGKRLVLYCASAWRSALATETLQKMGVPGICHLEGGFSAWKKAELPVAEKPSKPHSG